MTLTCLFLEIMGRRRTPRTPRLLVLFQTRVIGQNQAPLDDSWKHEHRRRKRSQRRVKKVEDSLSSALQSHADGE